MPTVINFPNLVVVELGASSGVLPPLTDGAPAIFRPGTGQMFLRNQNSGLYHELVASRVGGFASLGCVEVGVPFSGLPPGSSLDGNAVLQDGQNTIVKPAAGKLFVRAQVAPFTYYSLGVWAVSGFASVGIEETGLAFASLPASAVPNTTPAADGQDVIYRPATGRLYARNRSSGGLYHELAVYTVGGAASVGCLSVGIVFASIL